MSHLRVLFAVQILCACLCAAQESEPPSGWSQIPASNTVSIPAFFGDDSDSGIPLTNSYIVESKGDTAAELEIRYQQSLTRPQDSQFPPDVATLPGESRATTRLRQQRFFRETRQGFLAALNEGALGNSDITLQPGEPGPIANYAVLTCPDVTACQGVIAQLEAQNFSVTPNAPVSMTIDRTAPLIGAASVWNLLGPSNAPLDGRGFSLAVIDTGLDYGLPDFGGCTTLSGCARVKGYDFINKDADPMDDNGHGTHVASIAAGNGAMKGMAPKASLLIYKVLGKDGQGDTAAVLAALNRAADPNGDGSWSDHASVINMSLGISSDHSPDSPISRAVEKLVQLGSLVVIAAGNSGPAENTVGVPGAARSALTVTASTVPAAGSQAPEDIAYFSSVGPVLWRKSHADFALVKPDISAPGDGICARRARLAEFPESSNCSIPGYVRLSGTSMATPHVAGAALLFRQAHPAWGPRGVRQALINSADPLTEIPLMAGNGRVNVLRAIQDVTQSPTIIRAADLPPSPSDGVYHVSAQFSAAEPATRTTYLEIAPFVDTTSSNPLAWQVLKSHSMSGVLQNFFYTLDARGLADGRYLLRFRSHQSGQPDSVAYAYLAVKKLDLVSPLPGEVFRTGTKIHLEATQRFGTATPVFSYLVGRTTGQWHAIDGSEWDTANLADGFYTVKVALPGAAGDEQFSLIYLDSTLHQGFPIALPYTPCGKGAISNPYYACQYSAVPPLLADLDSDNAHEVLLQTQGNPGMVTAYGPNGQVKAQFALGARTKNINSAPMVRPIVAYSPELHSSILFSFSRRLKISASQKGATLSADAYNEIYAFFPNGQAVPGWPVRIPPTFTFGMTAADLAQQNTHLSLVVLTDHGTGGKLSIYDMHGALQLSKNIPDTETNGMINFSYPIVGNIDADPALEIAFPLINFNGTIVTEIHVYNADGSAADGFPKNLGRVKVYQGSFADLDGDGKEDLIVGLGGTPGLATAIGEHGRVLPGWPLPNPEGLFKTHFALGDLDGDRHIDIALCAASVLADVCGTFRGNGQSLRALSGTPVWETRPLLSDALGVGRLNLIGGSFFGIGYDQRQTPHIGISDGGVWGFDEQGAQVSQLRKRYENYLTDSISIGDTDGDGLQNIVATAFRGAFNRSGLVQSKDRVVLYSWDLPGRATSADMPWPMDGANSANTHRAPAVSTPIATPVATPRSTCQGISHSLSVSGSDSNGARGLHDEVLNTFCSAGGVEAD